MMARICAIFVAAVVVTVAISASAEESSPQCKDGAIITVSGKMFDDPAYDDDSELWAFESRDIVSPCFGDVVLSKSKLPATCRSGRQFVAKGKLSDGLFGGHDFMAISIECK